MFEAIYFHFLVFFPSFFALFSFFSIFHFLFFSGGKIAWDFLRLKIAYLRCLRYPIKLLAVPNSFQIGLPYLENRLRAVYSLPPCWIFVDCEFEIERESHVVIPYFSC